MNAFGIIATWYMADQGVKEAYQMLESNQSSQKALITAIKTVEDNPRFKSVGLGGLPNQHGIVELDGAYMDGDNFDIGCVSGLIDYESPIEIAYSLSKHPYNCFLTGAGSNEYAKEQGFKAKPMLTSHAYNQYIEKLKTFQPMKLKAYDGHDTVGMVCLDKHHKMTAGTSTSGLFMKRTGRMGDSPIIGSGLYVDSDVGGCCATGVGEEIMKGCLSYEVVSKMSQGLPPMQACLEAMNNFNQKLIKKRQKAFAMSIVALDKEGNYGVASNVEFTFCVATHKQKPIVLVYTPLEQGYEIKQVFDTTKWAVSEEYNI